MNKPINDGGPAFPHGEIVQRVTLDDGRIADRVWEPHSGMSLRDYFAAQVIQGLLANPGGPIQANPLRGFGPSNCTWEEIPKMAFYLADAMLKAREEKE